MSKVRISTFGALWLIASVASAEERIDPEKVVGLASRVGLGVTKLWMDHGRLSIPPSTLPPEERGRTVETALQRYQDTRNGYHGASTATQGIGLGVEVVVAGALLYAGPQAAVTVPLTLVGAASALSFDMANRRIEEIGERNAATLLAGIRDGLVEESGANGYEALRKDPVRLKETLLRSNRFLQDAKARAYASKDEGLLVAAADAIARAAANTDVATLDALAAVGGSVTDLDSRFGRFAGEMRESDRRVNARLEEHEDAIVAIGNGLEEMDRSIRTVGEEVGRLGRNQDMIADFMFSSLPPGEKAEAVRSGLMDARIACPSNAVECDAGKVKAALVERFESEATVQLRVAQAGQILKGINDVQAITTNLGVDLGRDGNRAVEIASTAVDAYIGFMAGDYLGSIASITGMFGRKPDPDAERFKVMMGFLEEQFGVINGKLDAILANQQTILDAVTGVSQQLRTSYEALDGRLEQMQVEQRRISDNVKSLIWKDWISCYALYSYSLRPNPNENLPPIVEPTTLAFPTFAAIRTVVAAKPDETRRCLGTVSDAMTAVTASRWFGNFLDADRSLSPDSLPDPGTLDQAVKDEANGWRDALELHKRNVVAPATSIAADFARRRQLSPAAMLFLNASTVPDTRTLGALQGTKTEFACDGSDPGIRAIRGLLCASATPPDQIASDLASTTLNTDILLDIADWMVVVAQLADVYDAENGRFARNTMEVADLPGPSIGEEITRKLVDMMTLAVAYHNRLHGGVTALAVAEDIRDGRLDERHAVVLSNNPYLAENAANVLIHLVRGNWDIGRDDSRVSFPMRYAQAYVRSRGDTEDRYEPLYALLGRSLDLGLTNEGRVGFALRIGEANVVVPLPAPSRLAEGAFVFPPRRDELAGRRDRLIERYLDYMFGHDGTLVSAVVPQ